MDNDSGSRIKWLVNIIFFGFFNEAFGDKEIDSLISLFSLVRR